MTRQQGAAAAVSAMGGILGAIGGLVVGSAVPAIHSGSRGEQNVAFSAVAGGVIGSTIGAAIGAAPNKEERARLEVTFP